MRSIIMKNICLNGLNERGAPMELKLFWDIYFYRQRAPTERK